MAAPAYHPLERFDLQRRTASADLMERDLHFYFGKETADAVDLPIIEVRPHEHGCRLSESLRHLRQPRDCSRPL